MISTLFFPLIDNDSNPLTGSKAILRAVVPPYFTGSIYSPTGSYGGPTITYSDNTGTAYFSNVIDGLYLFSYGAANANQPQYYTNYDYTNIYVEVTGSGTVNGFTLRVTSITNTQNPSIAYTQLASDARYILQGGSVASASYALVAQTLLGSIESASFAAFASTASFALNAGGSSGTILVTGSTYPITSSVSVKSITASFSGTASALVPTNDYTVTNLSSLGQLSVQNNGVFPDNNFFSAQFGNAVDIQGNQAGLQIADRSNNVHKWQHYATSDWFRIWNATPKEYFVMAYSTGKVGLNVATSSVVNQLDVGGNISCSVITASLHGNADTSTTASFATTANSINFVPLNATTASFAVTSSAANSITFVPSVAVSASFATTTISASFATNATTAAFANALTFTPVLATSSSFASTASYVKNADSSSFATTASFVSSVVSSSYAGTASVLLGSITSASYASFASTASFSLNGMPLTIGAQVTKSAVTGSYTNDTGYPAILVVMAQLQVESADGCEMRVTKPGLINQRYGTFRMDNEGAVQITANSTMTNILAPNDAYDIVNVSVSSGNTVLQHYLTPIIGGGGSGLTLITGSTYPITSSWANTASVYLGSVTSASFASTASYVKNAVSSSFATTATSATTATIANSIPNVTPLGLNIGIDNTNPTFTLDVNGKLGSSLSSSAYIDLGNTQLVDFNLSAALDWNNRHLLDASGVANISWAGSPALNVTGEVAATSFVGPLTGNADTATSASYAKTASVLLGSITSASYSVTSSFSVSSSYTQTASYALNSPATTLTTASTYQITSSWSNVSQLISPVTWSALTAGATVTWSVAPNVYQDRKTLIVTGPTTMSIQNLYNGFEGSLKITNGNTGSLLKISPTIKTLNGGTGSIGLTNNSASIDFVALQYDGTTLFAAFGNNFN